MGAIFYGGLIITIRTDFLVKKELNFYAIFMRNFSPWIRALDTILWIDFPNVIYICDSRLTSLKSSFSRSVKLPGELRKQIEKICKTTQKFGFLLVLNYCSHRNWRSNPRNYIVPSLTQCVHLKNIFGIRFRYGPSSADFLNEQTVLLCSSSVLNWTWNATASSDGPLFQNVGLITRSLVSRKSTGIFNANLMWIFRV